MELGKWVARIGHSLILQLGAHIVITTMANFSIVVKVLPCRGMSAIADHSLAIQLPKPSFTNVTTKPSA